jgi:hypothetical protein
MMLIVFGISDIEYRPKHVTPQVDLGTICMPGIDLQAAMPFSCGRKQVSSWNWSLAMP